MRLQRPAVIRTLPRDDLGLRGFAAQVPVELFSEIDSGSSQ